MNDLVVAEKINALALFTEGEQIDKILGDIKKKAKENEPDLSTAKSRKEIASIAYKVSQSKTLLDSAGKDLVKGWKDKAKQVDASRKKTREFLDNLRDEVRKPLTDWEAEEKERIKQEYLLEQYNADFDAALIDHGLFLREKAIAEKEALAAKAEEERKVKEAEAKAKEEKALASKAQKEREEQMKRESAEKARKDAEAKAENARIEAEKKLLAEKEASKKAEREKIEAEAKANAEKELAVKQAKQEAERKAREVKEEAERKAIAEKQEAERIESERIAEERRKAENKAHQKKVNNSILASMSKNGISEDVAKKVIILVASGNVPEMKILY